ncbi:MAG TPA: DUF4349 domain-containing protein [Mycobacteriales bacterium]|nr:DUF4349 domain-containing protein [Mycobacteriales bacterium]
MDASRRRYLLLGVAVLVVLLAGVFALGALLPGGHDSANGAGSSGSSGAAEHSAIGTGGLPSAPGVRAAPEIPSRAAAATSGGATAPVPDVVNGPGATASGSGAVSAAVDQTTATRIVRTGSISLVVAGNDVASTVDRVSAVATSLGGYVQSSDTERGSAPSGTVTLRMPVAKFGEAVARTEQLGHVVSASTSSRDVTGRYVDLVAREHSLRQTRATYLAILSHASTIGATLAVQNRIDDVQSQIEQLQGQISLLRHQSADATLSVDVTTAGVPVPHRHHATGLTAAWHTTTHRFARGFEAIVGILGPLLLALLIAALLVAAAFFGRRAVRRFAR